MQLDPSIGAEMDIMIHGSIVHIYIDYSESWACSTVDYSQLLAG